MYIVESVPFTASRLRDVIMLNMQANDSSYSDNELFTSSEGTDGAKSVVWVVILPFAAQA